jgi:hypothetical protein
MWIDGLSLLLDGRWPRVRQLLAFSWRSSVDLLLLDFAPSRRCRGSFGSLRFRIWWVGRLILITISLANLLASVEQLFPRTTFHRTEFRADFSIGELCSREFWPSESKGKASEEPRIVAEMAAFVALLELLEVKVDPSLPSKVWQGSIDANFTDAASAIRDRVLIAKMLGHSQRDAYEILETLTELK